MEAFRNFRFLIITLVGLGCWIQPGEQKIVSKRMYTSCVDPTKTLTNLSFGKRELTLDFNVTSCTYASTLERISSVDWYYYDNCACQASGCQHNISTTIWVVDAVNVGAGPVWEVVRTGTAISGPFSGKNITETRTAISTATCTATIGAEAWSAIAKIGVPAVGFICTGFYVEEDCPGVPLL